MPNVDDLLQILQTLPLTEEEKMLITKALKNERPIDDALFAKFESLLNDEIIREEKEAATLQEQIQTLVREMESEQEEKNRSIKRLLRDFLEKCKAAYIEYMNDLNEIAKDFELVIEQKVRSAEANEIDELRERLAR